MSFAELLLVAIGLSMDAFAVAVCRGLEMRRIDYRQALLIAVFFGGFQALMPVVGYLLGAGFERYISAFDHWIAFALLALIGGNMIREALSQEEEEADASLRFQKMFPLAVATSIDALSVGFTISEYGWLMALVCSLIVAAVTFFLCEAGLSLGKKFGTELSGKASILGGVILIGIGLEIFISGVFG